MLFQVKRYFFSKDAGNDLQLYKRNDTKMKPKVCVLVSLFIFNAVTLSVIE